jgi:hypothetical protein
LGLRTIRRSSSAGSAFKKRLVQVATAITTYPQHSLPKACDDWADLKAAYRLLSNPRVTADAIQAAHRRQTLRRCKAYPVTLSIQDTTELDFTGRKNIRGLGPIGNGGGQGLLQHSALAVTPERRVVGLLHQQWLRRVSVPKGETRRQRLARPKESDVWPAAVTGIGRAPRSTRMIQVCDRKGDCFQTMQACDEQGHGFLIRAQHDRCVNQDTDKLWSFMGKQPVIGQRRLSLPASHGRPARKAKLELRCAQVALMPPQHDPRFSEVRVVWAVYATEPKPPKQADPIEWLLLTSEPTETVTETEERLDWYTCRWIVEDFHKVEKTGCRLEASQLDDAEDVQRLAAIVGVTAVRLLMLRYLAQRAIDPTIPAAEPEELQRAVPWLWIVVVARADKKDSVDPQKLTPREFWLRIARQGGYIGRSSDGRPGWSTIWKGWYDFMFMFHGAELMAEAPMPPKCG